MTAIPISSDLIEYVVSQSQEETAPYLYAGKMGYAITLFGLSRAMNDEHLEDMAFLLLQQSLAASSQHVGFEQGLAGLGYGLLYLIQEEFIDGDFMELFGDKLVPIQKEMENIEFRPMDLLNHIQMPLFLHRILPFLEDKQWAQDAIIKILHGIELYLSVQFNDWCEVDYIGSRPFVLKTLQNYLRLIFILRFPHPSPSLIDTYCQLFLHHHISSSLAIGAYLSHLSKNKQQTLYSNVAELNLYYAAQQPFLDYKDLLNLLDDIQALLLTGIELQKSIEKHWSFLRNNPTWHWQCLLKNINLITQPKFII